LIEGTGFSGPSTERERQKMGSADEGVLFKTFRVRLVFENRIVGGIPVIPEGADRSDAYEKWARGQEVEQDPAFEKPLHDALADDPDMPVSDASAEDVAGLETGFRHDDTGIYIEARQVKAMIREASQRLGLIQKVRGTRQVVQHDIHVRSLGGVGQKIRFYRDGLLVADADGVDTRPISVVTRQGPRTAIKRFGFVSGATIEFDVMVLSGGVGDGIVGGKEIRRVFKLGGFLGLGADRSQGEGTFSVVSLEEVDGDDE